MNMGDFRDAFLSFRATRRKSIGMFESVARRIKSFGRPFYSREGSAQDITERKRAEEALRESEERYRDLVENSRELICTHDLDGLILSANRAATEVLGHDREDYFGKKNLREILTPEALEGFEDYLARIRNDGVASGIMLVQTSSGERRIWEYYNTLRTAGVAAPIVRGMARDITDRKRAEEALRESEERYRKLFENAKDATFVHDLRGRYTSVNRAAEKLLGYARAEILGKEVIHFFPPEQLEHIRECSRKLVDEGETAYESEVITKDGRCVAVDVESHLIFENGVAVAVQGTARDITERKRLETERDRFFTLSLDMLCIASFDGFVKRLNPMFQEVLGFSEEEFLSTPYLEFIHPEDRAATIAELEQLATGASTTNFQARFACRDGTYKWLAWTVAPFTSEGLLYATARDVTERKAAEEKLKTTSEQLRALSARLQSAREEEGIRIAREIHDELGSALTGLRWSLDEIDGKLSSSVTMTDVDKLRQKIAAMVTVIGSTLDTVRRISSELRPSLLDDVGLVAAIRWQAQQFAARTGIACNFASSMNTDHFRREQSTAVFRILQEALTNIARHAKATRVDIAIMENAGQFILTIRDNGRGITANQQSGAETLGIIGMRERAHLIEGEFTITNGQGQGTVVTVRVPLADRESVRRMTL